MAVAASVSLSWCYCRGAFCAWPAYPDRNVPRTPRGQVNLEAPAPKTADGSRTSPALVERVVPWRPVQPLPVSPPGQPPAATLVNLRTQGTCRCDRGGTAEGGRKVQNSKDNPDAHCLPMGLMQVHMHPQPRKIIQTRDAIVILYEGNAGVRQIFTDGRPLPNNDPQPWWYGYSVGRWEGDTLVVETIGFRDGGWHDIDGSPLTDATKMTERWRRLNYGTVQIDVTIDDAKAYTRPFSVRAHNRLMLDGALDAELIEFICQENNRAPSSWSGSR